MTAQTGPPVHGPDFPAADNVTAAAYEVPTERPAADGTLAWSSTTLIVARVTGGGRTGIGTPAPAPPASR